jgi:hypothetical protein
MSRLSPKEKIREIFGEAPTYYPKATKRHPRPGWYIGSRYLGRNSEEVICRSSKYQGPHLPPSRGEALALAQKLPTQDLEQVLALARADEEALLARMRELATQPASDPGAESSPGSDMPAGWALGDHTLVWIADEHWYTDANVDAPLIGVVLLNRAARDGVQVSAWKKRRARVEFFQGDQGQAEHLAEELRRQYPGAEVELRERPTQAKVDQLPGSALKKAGQRAKETVQNAVQAAEGFVAELARKVEEKIEGPSCPADQEECSYGLLGGACGLPAPLYLPGAAGPQERPARYCLIDARKLKPSHNPLAGFTPTPGYPKDTQEWIYQHDKAEQEKVYSIGQKLKPAIVFQPSTDGINGPPITTEDGIVLGGNGRAQGLIVHYAEGGIAAKDYLRKHAPVYGFTQAQVERIEQPVVVRVLRAPGQDLARLVRLLNIPLTQGLDARAEAVGEARRLSGGVLQVLAAALSEDQTLAEYLGSADSRALVDELKRSEVITARNVKRYLDDRGLLNSDGRQMVERLMAAALLPDAPLLDDLGAGTQNVLARGAPYLLAASTSGPEWDLRPALRAAARDLVELRRQEAHSVSEYLRQGALLPDRRPAIEGVSLGHELLDILYQLGQKPLVFGRFAQAYARAAAYNPAGQGALFAEEKLTPAEALRRAAALAGVTL